MHANKSSYKCFQTCNRKLCVYVYSVSLCICEYVLLCVYVCVYVCVHVHVWVLRCCQLVADLLLISNHRRGRQGAPIVFKAAKRSKYSYRTSVTLVE